jgi:uncharacterized protein
VKRVPAPADSFDLASLQLRSGEGRRLELALTLPPMEFAGQHYAVEPSPVTATLDLSRMTGGGYAMRLRFAASLIGSCMRCLEPATPLTEVDAREVDAPGGGDELSSPYVENEVLDLRAWGRDAFALGLPAQVLCKPDCLGLCPECGVDLNTAGPEHGHERAPDPRWAALDQIRFE